MGFDLVARLKLHDGMSAKLRQAAGEMRKTEKVAAQMAGTTSRMESAAGKAGASLKSMAAGMATMKSQSSGILGSLGRMAAAAGGLALAGKAVKDSLGGAMGLEQNMIAMEHFIGLTQGTNKAKAAAEEYMKFLRQNANLTPFETGEVINAGRRAVNIAGGDIPQAKKLLQIAEDMAALNPGKTLSDSIKALADLKVGETERMKEFGFKISQEDIKSAGGAMNIMNGPVAKMFEGGAAKLSNSTSGIWSTITDTFSSSLSDGGVQALEKMRGPLTKVAAALNGGTLDKFFGKGSDMLASMVDKAVSFGTWLIAIKPQASAVFNDISNDIEGITDRQFIGIGRARSAET